MNGRQAFDIRHRVVEQHHALEVGDPDHVDAGVEQVDIQAFDLLGLAQRQGDIQAADAVQGDQFAQRGDAAQGWEAVVDRLRVFIGGNQAHQRLAVITREFVGQVDGQLAGADDQCRAAGAQFGVVAP